LSIAKRLKRITKKRGVIIETIQQSSNAQDRRLSQWFTQISSGSIKLPRFQRFEAWDRSRVTGFLNTVIQNLPVGVTLLLQVGDKEKFVSRYIATAPQSNGRPTEHLLDGQQRLTAFWRAMHNNYETHTYYVYLPQFDSRPDTDEDEEDEIAIHCQARWTQKNEPLARYPMWADSPEQCFGRGFVPVDLLRPEDCGSELDQWIYNATSSREPKENDVDALSQLRELMTLRQDLRNAIVSLRERVAHFNLPFLALPVSTSADVALQVFVNMNTNSKPLSMYDLTVAKVESVAGESLHSLQADTEARHPELTRFGDISWPLLTTAALMQGRMPNKKGVSTMDASVMVNEWDKVELCLVRAVDFVTRQHIYDGDRLPSGPVLAVLAACLDKLPRNGDVLGRGEKLLRAYMWSVFFTSRYDKGIPTRAYQDYKALSGLLERAQFSPEDYHIVPALRRTENPLPQSEQLMKVGWPRGSDRLARAILAVNLHFGALDFADGHAASFDSLKLREYHHVFPDALLSEANIESSLALNCALVTWKTNRSIGRKDPLEYLKDRVEWADEPTVHHRLRTHLLDYEELCLASYQVDGVKMEGEKFVAKLNEDFNAFLERRAKLVEVAAEHLANGDVLTLEGLENEYRAR